VSSKATTLGPGDLGGGANSGGSGSNPNPVDVLGKTANQAFGEGNTCPVPCASPFATSQAGLGNVTQVLGQH
jgi:hypothetical protein